MIAYFTYVCVRDFFLTEKLEANGLTNNNQAVGWQANQE